MLYDINKHAVYQCSFSRHHTSTMWYGLLVDPKHPSHRTSLTPSLVVQCVMCRWLGRRIPQKMPAPQVAAKSSSVKQFINECIREYKQNLKHFTCDKFIVLTTPNTPAVKVQDLKMHQFGETPSKNASSRFERKIRQMLPPMEGRFDHDPSMKTTNRKPPLCGG